MFPPDTCQPFLSRNLPCFDAVTGAVASWPGSSSCFCVGFLQVLPYIFFYIYRFDINPTHQRMCLTTTPQVCSSPHHGNLFLPGLTGAFHTGLACCYCLSLLSITQIGAMCIHMHAFGTLGRPLAARSGGACASLCFLQQQLVTAAVRHMSSVICMV